MTPEQCAVVLAALASEQDMGNYVKDALHQAAAYLTEIPRLLELIDTATEQINRTQITVDNATAEIQRLNLELTYARSRS